MKIIVTVNLDLKVHSPNSSIIVLSTLRDEIVGNFLPGIIVPFDFPPRIGCSQKT